MQSHEDAAPDATDRSHHGASLVDRATSLVLRSVDQPGSSTANTEPLAWVVDLDGDGTPKVIVTNCSAWVVGSPSEPPAQGTYLAVVDELDDEPQTRAWLSWAFPRVLMDGTHQVAAITLDVNCDNVPELFVYDDFHGGNTIDASLKILDVAGEDWTWRELLPSIGYDSVEIAFRRAYTPDGFASAPRWFVTASAAEVPDDARTPHYLWPQRTDTFAFTPDLHLEPAGSYDSIGDD